MTAQKITTPQQQARQEVINRIFRSGAGQPFSIHYDGGFLY